MVGECCPTYHPAILPPPYHAVGAVYPPPMAYPGVMPPAHVRQHQLASWATWAAQGGKGEQLRRAWERIGEEERRLREREPQAMGDRAGHAGGREAQVVEELHAAWADLRTRLERMETADWEGERPGEQAQGSRG